MFLSDFLMVGFSFFLPDLIRLPKHGSEMDLSLQAQ